MSEIEKMYENCGIKIPVARLTAEKQIELIKWFAIKGDFNSSFDIAKNTYDYWTMYFQFERFTAVGFEETLAGLINKLWQDLTEEERKQLVDILIG